VWDNFLCRAHHNKIYSGSLQPPPLFYFQTADECRRSFVRIVRLLTCCSQLPLLIFLNTDDTDLTDVHGFFISLNPYNPCYPCSFLFLLFYFFFERMTRIGRMTMDFLKLINLSCRGRQPYFFIVIIYFPSHFWFLSKI